MLLYLDKILAQLAYPLCFSLGLCLLALLGLALGLRRWAAGLVLVAVFWVGGWSLPVVSDTLRGSLEGRFANRPVAELPAADVAIVLGGGIRGAPPDWPYPDLSAGADRVWHAARLFHAGKAEYLLIAGGGLEWQGEREPESEAMRRFLLDLGVPESALLFEGRSRSTRENALHSAELLAEHDFGTVLLVTSALHMPRALASFRAVGIDAIPAPADFEVMPEPVHPLRWLPDAEALHNSTRALKEYLGLWVYRWRGWALWVDILPSLKEGDSRSGDRDG